MQLTQTDARLSCASFCHIAQVCHRLYAVDCEMDWFAVNCAVNSQLWQFIGLIWFIRSICIIYVYAYVVYYSVCLITDALSAAMIFNTNTWPDVCKCVVSDDHANYKKRTYTTVPSVLWRCWLGDRKGIRSVKNWVVGCWRGYLSGARCRLAYGPADATAIHCLFLQ